MPRERWFYAYDDKRRGPHRLAELVDALLELPEPRTRLVWKRGMERWTRAAIVPELARQLDRHLPPTPGTMPPTPAVSPSFAPEPDMAPAARMRTRPPAVAAPEIAASPLQNPLVWAGATLVIVVLAAVGLSFRSTATVVTPAEVGAVTADGGVVDPTVTGPDGAPVIDPAFAGWSATEADMPAVDVAKLRGVAAWEGDSLSVTVYNGSRWRVTEILVRTSRLEGDEFIDSKLLHPLVPQQENVDTGVAQILDKVAPQRRRPAVNPDDTRAFGGKAGAKPNAYRWRIEGARGYPPVR